MRRYIFFYLLPIFCCGAVNNMRPLTESLGQEVIEMDAPIKELPPEIDEEPSAEVEADLKTISTAPSSSAKTKDTRRKMKETEQTRSSQEEDEARIEKELSDLYKDSADYKADSGEVSNSTVTSSSSTTEHELKPIGRARHEFKFQPDTNNRDDVERFRTSVDVISCEKIRLTGTTSRPTSSGLRLASGAIILVAFLKFV